MYQPKTGEKCHCRRGIERDNCPACEGTGWLVDFAAIRRRAKIRAATTPLTIPCRAVSECANCHSDRAPVGPDANGPLRCEVCGRTERQSVVHYVAAAR
jgi:hypothetical protein